MIGRLSIGLALATCIGLSQVTFATAATKPLKVKVASIKEGAMIPAKFAFCQAAAQGHTGPAPDISPRVTWSAGPKGTKSYAIILHDTDSPKSDRDKMNKKRG